jgi:hypothetical protein
MSETSETKTIEQIRKTELDPHVKERIAAEMAEMDRVKQEAKARLPTGR